MCLGNRGLGARIDQEGEEAGTGRAPVIGVVGVADVDAPLRRGAERLHRVRKPSPAIFAHAVQALGAAAPERCVYVGDTYDADYRGATGAGLLAFLIDPRARAPIPEAQRLESLLAFEERSHGL